ncbi:MAG: branched-chain amino acid ABC transporter permease [Nitrososphaerota archaeon]|nr:branched-chain amino acid ABC transporter permease [Nitrososphaerota archaeon]
MLILLVFPISGAVTFLVETLLLYFLYVSLSTSWNFVGGFANLLNLGHAAFFGIGAFFFTIYTVAGVPFTVSMFLGAGTSALFALLLTPTFRLKGDYFAIATLILPFVMQSALVYIFNVTTESLPLSTRLPVLDYYYMSFALMLFSIGLIFFFLRSRYGYALRAMGEDEEAARGLGVKIVFYKSTALCLSAFIAGFAGVIYVQYLTVLLPKFMFDLSWTLLPVFMTLIGGIRTQWGPIIGAIIYGVLSQYITVILPGSAYSLLIFAVIIILIARFAPGGLASIRFRRRRSVESFQGT